MITELHLENWKSFGEATLYIDPLSILIGTNASGKSNVIDALVFLQRIASGIHVMPAIAGSDQFPPLRGAMDWIVRSSKNEFTLTVIVNKGDLNYEYSITCLLSKKPLFVVKKEYLKSFYKNKKSIAEKIYFFFDENLFSYGDIPSNSSIGIGSIMSKNSTLYEFASSTKIENERHYAAQYVVSALKSVFVLNADLTRMKNYSALSGDIKHDASNIAGVLAALPPERQKEIEDTLTSYASRLPERDIHRVYAEKVGKLGNDAMLYCDERWAESGEIFTVDARAMSDGTLRFLAILTALLTLPEGSLLVIDEVDNGLHPSRAQLLLDSLQTIGKKRNIDVLATTHNPALLDAMGTGMVPFVTVAHRDSVTGTSQLTLLEDIEQLPKLLAQGTVGKLSTQGLLEKSLELRHE